MDGHSNQVNQGGPKNEPTYPPSVVFDNPPPHWTRLKIAERDMAYYIYPQPMFTDAEAWYGYSDRQWNNRMYRFVKNYRGIYVHRLVLFTNNGAPIWAGVAPTSLEGGVAQAFTTFLLLVG